MAIENLYTRAGGVTIMQLGPATAANYRRSERMTRALLARTQDKAEREIIGGMISECDYAAEWLETGRRPGNRRGIERRAAYQRERPMDPIVLQTFINGNNAGGASAISDSDRFLLEEAMHNLSPLERECFEMAYGQCFSHGQVADMLGVSRQTVSTAIQRANQKITKNKETSLFLAE